MKKLTALLVTLACLAPVGCEMGARSGNGPVAVVDLDAVAKKLGKDKQILQMIEQRQLTLNEQFNAAQQSLIDQLNKKKSEFGELSEDESKQLLQLQKQANSILASTRTQAQTNLTAFQQEVVDRFRAEAKPIAMEIAAKKGCRVVLSRNDSVVFAFDEAVDLTNEVVAAMQSKSSSASASQALPPAPSQTAAKASETPVKQAATVQKSSPK